MRGFITRRFSETVAVIGYYDMETNEMIEIGSISGKWKNTDQVLKYCKKHRSEIGVPEGKQATVLSMETKTHLRKMSYEDFYANSTPVEETRQTTDKATKSTKKKGKKK